MKFLEAYTRFFQRYFPSPFSIAVILTIVTFLIALFLTGSGSRMSYIPELGTYWFNGMFEGGLLAFTVHMMLILVLGHIIALSKPAQKLIRLALLFCNSTASSVFVVTLLTILVAYFNWGLGLIFGAIFARKIGEHFQQLNKPLNYALVGAAAYVGLLVWHGGLSGSATLTVAGNSHSLVEQFGSIPLGDTVFGSMNLTISLAILIVIPSAMYLVGRYSINETVPLLLESYSFKEEKDKEGVSPAERLEGNKWIGLAFGLIIIVLFVYLAQQKIATGGSWFSVLNLGTTNLLLLGLALVVHGSFSRFLVALEEAIGDVSGILIQFPLYFGIMGIMKGSGLVVLIAEGMTNAASTFSLPIYTFLSAAIVNIFVPSGGGQWQIQGPVIAETAARTGTSVPKLIMALAYGDQLTNMLQPFWALPLLGITGLKAKDILPYTLLLFVLGFIIFLTGLIIF